MSDPIIDDTPIPGHNTDEDQERSCRNCGGAHHIQRCPEVLAALFDPQPTGAEIAHQFHHNYKRFARQEMRKSFFDLYRDAHRYARYMSERLPKQEPMTVGHVLRIWDRAAA